MTATPPWLPAGNNQAKSKSKSNVYFSEHTINGGLCVVTKMNAWKTVRCKNVERRRWKNVRPFFGGSAAKIGGWMEECREDAGCEKCVEGE